MKRVRREVAVDPEVLESHAPISGDNPINIFDALMRDLEYDEDGDYDGFNGLRRVVLDAMENLSEKDRYCLQAIFNERVTYNELGQRLGYKPQKGGSPQAFRATQRALERLKAILLEDDRIYTYLKGDSNANS